MKSKKKCKLGQKWLELKEYNCFFWYVLISSIVIVLLFAIIVWKIILVENYEFSLNFQDTIPLILTVLGVFIAFTAINIYSIFNSRINEEKQALQKLNDKYETKIEDLTKNYKKINRHIDKIITFFPYQEKTKLLLDEFELENMLRNLIDINIPIIDRITAAWKLIRVIEDKKKSINTTNLKDESKDLEGELIILKLKIKSRIKNKKFNNVTNQSFQDPIKRLKDLLNEKENTIS
ncbi:hypothetical protein AGMMS49965_02710 [Bacteroidia bacterium]|nr:hypothetical protein AGMMS49965_02710 [Bacteroidia bacterium]